MRERVLDLAFLVGVLLKGVDGLVEVVGGVVLLAVPSDRLLGAARAVTAHELAEDPHDVLANLLVHGVQHLDLGTSRFLAAYLLLHGLVKLAIVAALLLGTRRVYPWAIAALLGFLVFQVTQLIAAPTVTVLVLTVFDVLIVVLTWREWRQGRTLRETWRSTVDWVVRRPADTRD
ncbi:DUF2127 domain-containing protein [Agromyces aurantiacus]|uniref:DUF2127 domain-containing protein n=1 Tax=Agromyces aurantiacus TaxID=165814 RepID=A0ABV9R3U7_9MICO|nr:DUF2127 domain-containing protein [Agromyces aurantiacus]MBM7502790.1 putative membrane protein [Agromyces aurantiacus]